MMFRRFNPFSGLGSSKNIFQLVQHHRHFSLASGLGKGQGGRISGQAAHLLCPKRPSIGIPHRQFASNRFSNQQQQQVQQHMRLRMQNAKKNSRSNTTTVLYVASALITTIGVTYAAVPLYRMFCQATGYAGTVRTDRKYITDEKMQPNRNTRRYRVTFNADTSVALPWQFQPQQSEVFVYPGETALIFYTAENKADHDIIGISSYNIVPMKAGAYFNKIQCFCFEEQLLKAGEQVDMPVFFFLDPAIAEDPLMADVREITLSYTFFPATQGSSSWIKSPTQTIVGTPPTDAANVAN